MKHLNLFSLFILVTLLACNKESKTSKHAGVYDSLIVELSKKERKIGLITSELERIRENQTFNKEALEAGTKFKQMHSDFILNANFPREFVADPRMPENLSISKTINPFYLRGDFNGDCLVDLAINVENENGLRGILIIHQGKPGEQFLLGAGDAFANVNDFNWMYIWKVMPGTRLSSPHEDREAITKHEYLYVEKPESASGAIFWNGNSYEWYQQGD